MFNIHVFICWNGRFSDIDINGGFKAAIFYSVFGSEAGAPSYLEHSGPGFIPSVCSSDQVDTRGTVKSAWQ